MVEVITGVTEMAARSRAIRAGHGRVALVPTMGWLHDGHLALVAEARRRCPTVVVSIFVNPTQFGPNEDFDRYPRDLDRDCDLLASAGGAIVFAPTPAAMYPPGHQTRVEVEGVSRPLCGATRPGHFTGVATVVLKLLSIVAPDVAVFGEKDWQQLVVIRRMVRDLDLPVEIVGHPIVREADGMALSSRNAYLSPDERGRAVCLHRALLAGRDLVHGGERGAGRVTAAMRSIIEAAGGAPEYVAAVDPDTLADRSVIDAPTLLALAARLGPTRLIDNLLVDPPA
jgi:pantoate--beta-alanine ligase